MSTLAMTQNNEGYEIPGLCVIGIQDTDVLTREKFVWFRLDGQPTRGELRSLRQAWAERPPAFYYANVEARDERAMRFARFFGFQEVYRVKGISVQVAAEYGSLPATTNHIPAQEETSWHN